MDAAVLWAPFSASPKLRPHGTCGDFAWHLSHLPMERFGARSHGLVHLLMQRAPFSELAMNSNGLRHLAPNYAM